MEVKYIELEKENKKISLMNSFSAEKILDLQDQAKKLQEELAKTKEQTRQEAYKEVQEIMLKRSRKYDLSQEQLGILSWLNIELRDRALAITEGKESANDIK